MTLTRHLPTTVAWTTLVNQILRHGERVSPRDQPTREILGATAIVKMTEPVLGLLDRKLSYRGMAAEALWILDGRDDLAGLEPWLPAYRRFSDDGVVLQGAYGPRIQEQIWYVVRALLNDRDTRQAVLTTWRPNPEPSKDIPCTIGLTFQIREAQDGRRDQLHCHAVMRSSDVFMGFPYDAFAFSMIAAKVAALVNEQLSHGEGDRPDRRAVVLGSLFYYAASSHLYERDLKRAEEALNGRLGFSPTLPDSFVTQGARGYEALRESLLAVRDQVEPRCNLWDFRPSPISS